jgi:hypothetical protein
MSVEYPDFELLHQYVGPGKRFVLIPPLLPLPVAFPQQPLYLPDYYRYSVKDAAVGVGGSGCVNLLGACVPNPTGIFELDCLTTTLGDLLYEPDDARHEAHIPGGGVLYSESDETRDLTIQSAFRKKRNATLEPHGKPQQLRGVPHHEQIRLNDSLTLADTSDRERRKTWGLGYPTCAGATREYATLLMMTPEGAPGMVSGGGEHGRGDCRLQISS